MEIIFLAFKRDKNQLDWVRLSLLIIFIIYECDRCKIENEGDINPKLMRCFDKLKHEVESCYNDIVMHNYMIWLVYALIVEDIILMITLIDECIKMEKIL